ncbi:cobalamin biosynthesis protein [Carnimonas nigrificans]|uniref:cobalamin biosynthesis protein n=1 Tax=Carnimonas nigrificans TaxID=64323 RepID=UPI000471B148|nr:cobalamin biosynthesis protein [Carnimonas nigrificans]
MSQPQLALGIGFRQRCEASELMALIENTLARTQLSHAPIVRVASHHTKQGHPLLAAAAAHLNCECVTFASEHLAAQRGINSPSRTVIRQLATPSVAEAAALAALRALGFANPYLVVSKQRSANATIALAQV